MEVSLQGKGVSMENFSFSLFFAAVLLANHVNAQQCTVTGLCIGTTLQTRDDLDKTSCVQLCQSTPGCEWYTYDYKDLFCSAYSTCPVTDGGCTTCTSGENECPPQLCGLTGGCRGVLINEFNTLGDESRCGEGCAADASCHYYTYFQDSGNCLLYSTCEVDAGQCTGCVTSEKSCGGDTTILTGNILVAIKAFTVPEMSLIDLVNADVTCDSRSVGPLAVTESPQSLHGTFVGGQLLVCGEDAADCFVFDDNFGDWDRSASGRAQDRFLPYGVDLDAGRHWVTGGSTALGGETDTSEVWDGGSFQPGLSLPVPTRDHCMVAISSTEVLVMGGYGMSNRVFLMDLSIGGSTEIASVPTGIEGDILMAQCGLATRGDGSAVAVLAGGYSETLQAALDESYILELDLGVWLPGPRLPETRAWGRAVQFGDSFVLVGGGDDFTAAANMRSQILQFDPVFDSWIIKEQTLPQPDFVTVALMAPANFNVTCTANN